MRYELAVPVQCWPTVLFAQKAIGRVERLQQELGQLESGQAYVAREEVDALTERLLAALEFVVDKLKGEFFMACAL
jgi:hypothetical protein